MLSPFKFTDSIAATAPPAMDTMKKLVISDPQQTYRKILDLRDDTMYQLSIWAVTEAGPGQELLIDEGTLEASGDFLQHYYI